MANCIICESKLGFINTPTFGQGKLKDGNEICFPCFKKYGATTTKFKEMSTIELKDFISYKLEESENNDVRLIEIKKQIQDLKLSNTSSFLGRREINELPSILASDEVIDNIAQGTYNKGQGILVSTDRRLLFIDKGMIFGLKVEDFALDKISSIQYETGLFLGEIKIHTSGNIAKIENVEKATARSFSEFVRNKLSQPKATITNIINSEPNVLDQLEKLAKLKENGILTEEEFIDQKKKLLEKL
jgi:hypothetical protein